MLMAGMLVGLLILMIEWLTFKYAVPYWRRRGWTGWMFCSQVHSLGGERHICKASILVASIRRTECVGRGLRSSSSHVRRWLLEIRRRTVGIQLLSHISSSSILLSSFSLHSHTTRSDSLDLRAVNVPKLLRATYQLKEKMYEDYLPHRPNGNIGRAAATNDVIDDRQSLWARIDELEQEVDHLKSQLRSTGSLTTP